MQCKKCRGPLTTQDRASYGERCENCYVGTTPGTTGSFPAAVRNGQAPMPAMLTVTKRRRNNKSVKN